MEWVIVILFGLLSIIFLRGKGSFLIAGYNTASAEEKAKYDEKKLCRIMGGCTAVIAIDIALISALHDMVGAYVNGLLVGIIFLDVIVTLILVNTVPVRKDYKLELELDKKLAQQNKKITIATVSFVAVVFAIVGVLLVTGDVNVKIKQNELEVVGSYYADMTITYDEINKISLTDDFRAGSRTNGMGSFKLNEGHFKNKQFGNYMLYAYVDCKSYIIMETDTGIVVVNAKDADTTKQLYENIKKKL